MRASATAGIKKYTDEEKRKIVADWRASPLTAEQFADQLGIKWQRLYLWRKQIEKKPARVFKSWSAEVKAKAVAELNAGQKSAIQIAQELGTTPQVVYQWRKPKSHHKRQPEPLALAQRAPEPAAAIRIKAASKNGAAPSHALRCPCCGCDLAQEFAQLAMKLQALQSL